MLFDTLIFTSKDARALQREEKNSISRQIELFNLNDHVTFFRNSPSTIEYYSSNSKYVFLSYL
jgi:hypothetical protein